MKKIMFNDCYGLTQAVLDGKKTMTRRIIPLCENDLNFLKVTDRGEWLFSSRTCLDGAFPAYNVGDELAVAQAYKTLLWPALPGIDLKAITDEVTHSKGWTNKRFVKAEYMPHRIRITNIKVERLQDISEEAGQKWQRKIKRLQQKSDQNKKANKWRKIKNPKI